MEKCELCPNTGDIGIDVIKVVSINAYLCNECISKLYTHMCINNYNDKDISGNMYVPTDKLLNGLDNESINRIYYGGMTNDSSCG